MTTFTAYRRHTTSSNRPGSSAWTDHARSTPHGNRWLPAPQNTTHGLIMLGAAAAAALADLEDEDEEEEDEDEEEEEGVR